MHRRQGETIWLACSTPASCTCRTKSWCPPPAPLQPTTPLALPLGPARPPQAQASRESRAAVASDLDTLMRSISALSAPADGEASSGEADSGAGSSGRGVSANEARQVVSGLVEQINRLKRKVDEGRRAEAEGIARCRSRIACLLSHSSAPEDGAAGGGGARLADARCDRFVADYLLRTGRHHSASETSGRGVGVQLAASFDAGTAIRRPPCAPPPTAASPRCSTRGTRRVSLAHYTHEPSTGPPEHRIALACSCLLLRLGRAASASGSRPQAGVARRAPAVLCWQAPHRVPPGDGRASPPRRRPSPAVVREGECAPPPAPATPLATPLASPHSSTLSRGSTGARSSPTLCRPPAGSPPPLHAPPLQPPRRHALGQPLLHCPHHLLPQGTGSPSCARRSSRSCGCSTSSPSSPRASSGEVDSTGRAVHAALTPPPSRAPQVPPSRLWSTRGATCSRPACRRPSRRRRGEAWCAPPRRPAPNGEGGEEAEAEGRAGPRERDS